MHVESFLSFPPKPCTAEGDPNAFIPFSQTVLSCKVFQSFPVQIEEQNLLTAFPSCVSVQSGMNKKQERKI